MSLRIHLLSYSGAKGILGISLQFFHRVEFVSRVLLVRVGHKIDASRKIILVHGHTLKVMATINCNPNLSIASTTQANIRNTGPNVNNTVRVSATVFGITNLDSLAVDSKWWLDSNIRSSTIFGERSDLSDVGTITRYLGVLDIRRRKNFECRILTGTELPDLQVVDVVALFLKNSYCSRQLSLADTKMVLNASANVEILLLRYLSLQHDASAMKDIGLILGARVQQSANR